MAKKTSTKFTGVYYTESKVHLYREKPERIWWVNFKDSAGKLIWERVGTSSDGWSATRAQMRRHEIMEELRAGNYKSPQERRRDGLLFSTFMEKKYLPWSKAELVRHRDEKSKYKNWIGPFIGNIPMAHISPLHIEKIKKVMRDKGLSSTSIRLTLTLIRQAFNKAIEWGLFEGVSPISKVKFPKNDCKRTRFFSPEEAELLFDHLKERSPQVETMCRMSLYTGMRLGELAKLKWGHVDLAGGLIHVMDAKNAENRVVFISERLREVLSRLDLQGPDDLVFSTTNGKSIGWLSHTFTRAVKALGFNDGIEDSRHRLTFHSLRHSFASWAVIAGTPLFAVGAALGHKDYKMTQRYAHLTDESVRAAFSAVSNTKVERADNERRS